jgi:hypothetical protein
MRRPRQFVRQGTGAVARCVAARHRSGVEIGDADVRRQGQHILQPGMGASLSNCIRDRHVASKRPFDPAAAIGLFVERCCLSHGVIVRSLGGAIAMGFI